MQRRELRVFEDLTPDPRAGGFGPLFSTALLLGGIGCCILIWKRHFAYLPGWFVLIAAVASSFGSQVWWARWTPQNWLIVVALLMTILAAPAEERRSGSQSSCRDGSRTQRASDHTLLLCRNGKAGENLKSTDSARVRSRESCADLY